MVNLQNLKFFKFQISNFFFPHFFNFQFKPIISELVIVFIFLLLTWNYHLVLVSGAIPILFFPLCLIMTLLIPVVFVDIFSALIPVLFYLVLSALT